MRGILAVFLCLLPTIQARGSVWSYNVDKSNIGTFMSFPNYLYQHSYITVSVLCDSPDKDTQVRVQWVLEEKKCMEDMMNLQSQSEKSILGYVIRGELDGLTPPLQAPPPQAPPTPASTNETAEEYQVINFQAGAAQNFTCGDKHILQLVDESESPYMTAYIATQEADDKDKTKAIVITNRTDITNDTVHNNRVTSAWKDGMYHFFVVLSAVEIGTPFTAAVRVEMGGRYGFIPANKWPLLPYSAILAVIYLVLATAWVVLWARAHNHTLKIHLVIGAITVAGALCNTLMFINMASLNSNGQIMESVLWMVELLETVQDSLMHLLFMVVSTGYGITRPTLSRDILGAMFSLTMVNFLGSVGIGLTVDEKLQIKYLYPILSLVIMILYGAILLSIAGFIVFMSASTLHHLWKRKHSATKLHVFAAFMISSCVAFVVSIAMIGFANGFYTTCRTDWQHEWLYANFGHLISVGMLVGVMWLWRPVDTAQSYAFAPLATDDMAGLAAGDSDDEGGEEMMGVKDGRKLTLNMEAL